MKKAKIIQCILMAIWLLQFAAEALALVSVWRLDMLPNKYFVLLTAFLLVLWLGTGALLLWKGRRPDKMSPRRWIACALVVLTVAACAVGVAAVAQLRQTLQNVTNQEPTGIAVGVYVRKEDPAVTLRDAADYTFSSVRGYEEHWTAQAVEHITKELGKQPATSQHDTVFAMLDALYEKQTDAVILNSAYVQVLEGVEQYADFAAKTKLLYEVVLAEEPAPTDDDPPEDETAPPVTPNITNTPFVVYISGSDTRSSVLTTSLSDVNILAVVNPNTNEILLLNTPRDYYIQNPAGGGARDKLTHCGIYGINCSIQVLSKLYDLEVDCYVRINFKGFKRLIDAIGGVDVYADAAVYGEHEEGPFYIPKGHNHLNGTMALAFARERYHVAGGDFGRAKNQMKVITAVIDKMTSSTALITNYSAIMQSLKGMFETNMEASEISQLVKMQLDEMPKWNVHTYAVNGPYGEDETYSMPGWKVSVTYVNQKMVDHGADLIRRVMAGEILTDEDLKGP